MPASIYSNTNSTMFSKDNILTAYGLRGVGGVAASSFKNVDLTKYPIINSKELVGIEIEIENYVTSKNAYHGVWSAKEDGSLRNNGREFITKPCQAEYIPYLLHNLFNEHLAESASCTPRTSVHVHLNMLDVPVEKINLFVLFYSLYEKVLFSWIGKNRYKNIYCVPITSSYLIKSLHGYNVPDWSKYTALNLAPLSRQGTVEFRAMHGTKDIEKLSKWVSMIVSMKAFIMSKSTSELEKIYKECNPETDYLSLGKEFLGEQSVEILHKHGFLESRIEDAYPFLLGKHRYSTVSNVAVTGYIAASSLFVKRKS